MADDWQPASTVNDDWQPVAHDDWQPIGQPAPSIASDVAKSLVTGAIKGNANLITSGSMPEVMAPAMAVKYGVPAIKTGADYAAQDVTNLARMATGNSPVSENQWNAEDERFAKEYPILNALDPATLASKIPSPADIVSKVADVVGHPLYKPQTGAGRIAEEIPEYAGLGGAKALQAIPSAIGLAGAPEAVKSAGGNQQFQFLAGLAGGAAGTKLSNPAPELPDNTGESLATITQKSQNGYPPSVDDAKAHAQDVYNAADILGGTLTPRFAQDQLASWKGKEPVTPVEIANAKTDPLRNFAKDYEDAGFANSPVSLSDVQSLDKKLGDLAWNDRDAFGNVGNDGRRFLAAQKQLRQVALNATTDNGYAAGDTTGFGALKYATQLYAQQAKMADLQRVMDKAANAENPVNAAKNGFRALLNNGKKTIGYSDDELQAIENATKSGLGVQALNLMSSKLIPIIAAGTGHFDLGATALGLQAGTRALSSKLQQSRTQAPYNMVANRDFGPQPDYIALAKEKQAAQPTIPDPSLPPDVLESKLQDIATGANNATGQSTASGTPFAKGGKVISTGKNKDVSHSSGTEGKAGQGFSPSTGAKRLSPHDENINLNPTDAQKSDGTSSSLKSRRSKDHTSINESSPDNSTADLKLFSDSINAHAIYIHGFNSFDRKSQHMVLSQMVRSLNDKKILKFVIQAIPIDVMDMFIGFKWTSNMLFHNKSMLTHRLTVPPNVPVPKTVIRFVDSVAAFLERGFTDRGTKESNLPRPSPSSELSTTKSADSKGFFNTGATTKKSFIGPSHSPRVSYEGNSTGGTNKVDGGHMRISNGDYVNINPSEAQKQAGVYKKGHMKIYGIPITIENPKGSIRKGKDKNGHEWEAKLSADYGYFKRTEAADGDHVDCYIGPKHGSPLAFVVDQIDKDTGKYDEAKVMLGFLNQEDAIRDYKKAFSDGKGHDRIGKVSRMTIQQLKDWLKSGDTKNPVRKVA